jgi:hypothetical protein
MKVTVDDVARAASLGVTLKPGDAPLAIARLANVVFELQQRVAALEQAAPRRKGLLASLGRRA